MNSPIFSFRMGVKSRSFSEQALGPFGYLKRTVTRIILSPFRLLKIICFLIGFFAVTVFFCLGLYLVHIYRSAPDFNETGFKQLKEKAKKIVYHRLEESKNFKNYRWTEIADIN